jgi:hypothetical protein
MIIARIQAGLGNQLFQYAAGRALALRSNQEFKIDLHGFDMKNLATQQKTNDIFVYRLDLFNITATLASKKEVSNLHEPFGIISKKWNMFKQLYVGHGYTDFLPRIYRAERSLYLDGYWQSERYFDDFQDVIRKEFQLKKQFAGVAEELFIKIKNAPQSCFIHIRRGDYVKNGLVQKLDYFTNAVEHMKKSLPDIEFFVFSNDIPWAQKHLDTKKSPVNFISDPNLTPQEELMLMSKCDHAIISNSSFSWWGAWLINSPTKKVIAPRMWSEDSEKEKHRKYVVPETWTRM